MALNAGCDSRMHSPRIIPQQKTQQKLQMIKARGELEFPMRPSWLEPSEASNGGSIPQKTTDVVFPVGIPNEICDATHSTGLEQALSIPLLESNRQASMPSIQNADFPPVSSAGDLWVLLGDGANGIPQETKSLLTPPTEGLNGI